MLCVGAIDGIGSIFSFRHLRGHYVGGFSPAHADIHPPKRERIDKGMPGLRRYSAGVRQVLPPMRKSTLDREG
jgi:hypothetical protein